MEIELIPEIFEKVFGGKENRCEREVQVVLSGDGL